MPDLSELRELERAGYFKKVADGDHRACGLFARMAAHALNPTGDPQGWGALRKNGPGRNVEGYSEDAIVLGSNPADRNNVCDIINSAGAPGATLNTRPSFVNRRESDVWEKPVPLNAEQLAYLKGDAAPGPTPTPTPTPTPVPVPPPVDLGPVLAAISALSARVGEVEEAVTKAIEHANEHGNAAHAVLELDNLSKRLEAGLSLNASVKLVGPIRGTVALPPAPPKEG